VDDDGFKRKTCDGLAEIWPWNPQWTLLLFPDNEFLVKNEPVEKMQEIVALGVVTVSCCRIRVRQWSALEEDHDEQRNVNLD